ncbi:MAG: hypothetical protein HQM10_22350 [Candidatus Riflebacteria bacterium]|nr:hypothetical protein [Candidatus Riflebacteria bacterium]
MKKISALLIVCLLCLSYGCGTPPKEVPPDQVMPVNPANDPAASVPAGGAAGEAAGSGGAATEEIITDDSSAASGSTATPK